MGLFTRFWRDCNKANRSGMVRLTGSCLIGSSGAITSYDAPGFTITKQTAAGRYRIQLIEQDGTTACIPPLVYSAPNVLTSPYAFQDFNVSVVSVEADSAMTTSSGIHWAIRNYTPASGYFDIQFFKDVTSSTDETHTDVNVESGGRFFIGFSVKTSSAVP